MYIFVYILIHFALYGFCMVLKNISICIFNRRCMFFMCVFNIFLNIYYVSLYAFVRLCIYFIDFSMSFLFVFVYMFFVFLFLFFYFFDFHIFFLLRFLSYMLLLCISGILKFLRTSWAAPRVRRPTS